MTSNRLKHLKSHEHELGLNHPINEAFNIKEYMLFMLNKIKS